MNKQSLAFHVDRLSMGSDEDSIKRPENGFC